MRKKLVIAAVLVIAIALIAAGTFAPEAIEGLTTNVITTGNVEIAVNEYQKNPTPGSTPELYPAGRIAVMPDKTVSKIVKVENTGDAEAWVRVWLSVKVTGADGKNLDIAPVKLVLDSTNKDWQYVEGWYYYTKPLAVGSETKALLDSVEFSPGMGNEYQNSTVTVSIEAQAVQSKNNPIPAGGSVFNVTGWPAVAIPTPTPSDEIVIVDPGT